MQYVLILRKFIKRDRKNCNPNDIHDINQYRSGKNKQQRFFEIFRESDNKSNK